MLVQVAVWCNARAVLCNSKRLWGGCLPRFVVVVVASRLSEFPWKEFADFNKVLESL